MPPQPARHDPRALERAFARLFSTDDGRIVLNHLQALAFLRAHGPDATEAQLRHAEGQRALAAQIAKLIEAGRRG